MYSNQNCEWLIQPSGIGPVTNVVVEFLACDLRGGAVEVFDGSNGNDNSTMLWSCIGCSYIPKPIISSKGFLFVRSSTLPNNPTLNGNGFRIVYWSLNAKSNELKRNKNKTSEESQFIVLEIPSGALIKTDKQFKNRSAFYLSVPTSNNSLSLHSSYIYESSKVVDVKSVSMDGRSPDSEYFQQPSDVSLFCGVVKNSEFGVINEFIDKQPSSEVVYRSTQSSKGFLHSRSKTIYNYYGTTNNNIPTVPSLLQSSTKCKYILSSGSTRSITIEFLPNHRLDPNTIIIIYGGVYGYDRVTTIIIIYLYYSYHYYSLL
jgi:hypothetical protein